MFYKLNSYHRTEDFERKRKELDIEEVQIYTWKDATLRELTTLIKEIHQGARHRTARLSFALIYPDKTGRLVLREIGQTQAFPRRGDPLRDDNKTLDEVQFETGDFLDVAIHVHG